MSLSPYIIQFDKIGDSTLGYISVAENIRNIPFEIKRVYWTYYTPQNVMRGGHSHRHLHQIIFAVSGIIRLNLEKRDGELMEFTLDKPNEGLYIPPFVWRKIQFSHNAVLMCLASACFEESDYIRNYNQFKDEIRNLGV